MPDLIYGEGTQYQVEYEVRWYRGEGVERTLEWAQSYNRTEDRDKADRWYEDTVARVNAEFRGGGTDATGRVRIVELVTTATVVRSE